MGREGDCGEADCGEADCGEGEWISYRRAHHVQGTTFWTTIVIQKPCTSGNRFF